MTLGIPDPGPLAGIQMILNERYLKKTSLSPSQWPYSVPLLRGGLYEERVTGYEKV